jgi:hypothetical protein
LNKNEIFNQHTSSGRKRDAFFWILFSLTTFSYVSVVFVVGPVHAYKTKISFLLQLFFLLLQREKKFLLIFIFTKKKNNSSSPPVEWKKVLDGLEG